MHEFLSQVYAAVLPPVLLVLSTLLGSILARAASVAKARWGIEIEVHHREALHSAVFTGLAAALQRGLSKDAAIEAAIAHALKSGAPDAIDYFGLGVDDLDNLARSKLDLTEARMNAGADLNG